MELIATTSSMSVSALVSGQTWSLAARRRG
jgi:hypothetical protein